MLHARLMHCIVRCTLQQTLVQFLTENKCDDHPGDVSSRLRLHFALVASQLAGHFACAQMEATSHQRVQHSDDGQRQEVVDNGLQDDIVSAVMHERERWAGKRTCTKMPEQTNTKKNIGKLFT